MTILKTIDGQEIDSEKFQGFGTFKKYVQENIDPEFGKDNNTKHSSYDVEFSATKTVNVSLTITVEATTKKEAEKIAMQQALKTSSWDWQEGVHDDIDNIEIENVTISKDDDDE